MPFSNVRRLKETAARERLIVALDTSDRREVRRLLRALKGRAGCFKVGLQLFSAYGPSIVKTIVDAGERVFLDLKYHDIPNTAAHAVTEAVRMGASLATLHVAGGEPMLRSAVQAARSAPGPSGRRSARGRTRLLGVTVLTSLDAAALERVGIMKPLPDLAVDLARLARAAGLDGVVASAHEVAAIRAACGPEFLIVVPGIRPAGAGLLDQKRAATPSEALLAGATSLVVGRPITEARDPAAAADAILAEIEG